MRCLRKAWQDPPPSPPARGGEHATGGRLAAQEWARGGLSSSPQQADKQRTAHPHEGWEGDGQAHLPNHIHKEFGVVGGIEAWVLEGLAKPAKRRLVLVVPACSAGTGTGVGNRAARRPSMCAAGRQQRSGSRTGKTAAFVERSRRGEAGGCHMPRGSPQMATEGWLLRRAAWCRTSSQACRQDVECAPHALHGTSRPDALLWPRLAMPVPPRRTSLRKASSRGYMAQANMASCHTSTPCSSQAW